jgi:hypothetical protein
MFDTTMKRPQKNLVGARQELLADSERLHDIPPGERELQGQELELWKYLMRAKAYKEWSTSDLMLAYKYIKYDTVIRRGELRLDQFIEQGADILDPESYANEYYKEVEKVRSKQMLTFRALGLTHAALRQQNDNDNKDKKAAEELEAF